MEDARIPVRYAHCELEGFGLADNWRNPTLERFSLTERIGEPMRPRSYEMCKTVVMQGEDFRQKFRPDDHRL